MSDHKEDIKLGESFEQHAIVLSSMILKESDKLAHLYTSDFGKITVVAKGAAKSLKRFGPGLEPFTHIKAQLKKSKNFSEENKIFLIDRLDVKDTFPHLRRTYGTIETAFFVVKFILDLVPEGVEDPSLFKALGRILRDSSGMDLNAHASWARVAFLVWFARHSGFGAIDENLWDSSRYPKTLQNAWEKCLQPSEPNFKNLFEVIELLKPEELKMIDEIKIYQRWVEASGLHWEHFEKWLNSKNF